MTEKPAKTIPRATYRLQFHPGFTFEDAAAAADYLSVLGISHIYASPYLQAAHGSTHGYDVTDPTRVNCELGGKDAHKRLCKALERRGMGQILDIVPNHMEIFEPFSNKWWWDVLEKGRSGKYAGFFDIDWDPPEKRMAGKIVLPVLEDHYGRVLEAGKLSVEITDTRQWVCRYHDHIFPLSPESIASSSVRPAHLNESPDALDTVLQNQHYRLTYWCAASRDLNYRRFFAINSLAAVRAEDNTVFKKTHSLVLGWLGCGLIDGVRIDHPDGLKDPEGYLKRLQKAAPHAWIVVEKILHPEEYLPESWPVSGTTGYDFLNQAAGLFIDSANENRFTEIYEEFTGRKTAYRDLIHNCRHLAMEKLLGSDICRLTELLMQICERHRCFRDYTRSQLKAAVKELLACMPVYRTYVRKNVTASQTDQETISHAVSEAKTRSPEIDPRLFDFLSDICCNRIKGDPETEWMLRFQQTSGPVTAKGIEDTAFYRYNRLACLNEVGGDPSVFGISIRQFHEEMTLRSQRFPAAMLATSTHDTKRSEDVRARLALLSEIPDRWEKAVNRWAAHNKTHKNQNLPDSNIEYLLYQSLVGAWPIDSERACAFIQKAAREAAEHTCWEDPNTAYEQALLDFTKNIFSDEFFVSDLESFVKPLINPGRINSLAQVLLKLTAPGVPDIYQGTELWDLSLVDPDNRRPVDFDRRRSLLESLKHMNTDQIMADMDSGLPKLYLIQKTLELRKDRPELFDPSASYEPAEITGANHNHALAFTRGSRAVTIIPRLVMGFSGDWKDTRINLSKSAWQNILTGETFSGPEFLLKNILKKFPVALLVRPNHKP
ncbi:MAG: malto-oligosyltrehalose synthase [Desulfobacteraceae bacterium]|nr:malto-oligosyltrehalose synthase [Desulfobacteraceae bacterium]